MECVERSVESKAMSTELGANMVMTKPVEIVEADLARLEHQQAIVKLIDAYASDPMGNGQTLGDEVLKNLIPALRQHPTTYVFLAYQEGQAIGLAICFLGFSTFAAKPLMNIHDLAVLPDCRGQGIGTSLLQEVARKAREMGCCKLTLEVQENNLRARRVYENIGFSTAPYVKEAGNVLFLTKGCPEGAKYISPG
jgi:ribosomal protein S18 acetylase RimI-like enzyme